MYTFLCHLKRKRSSGPFVTQLVNALFYALLRFAAPFVSFKQSWIKRIHGVLTQVAKAAQGFNNRLRSDLFYCYEAMGNRPPRVVIDSAILAAASSLLGSFTDVIQVLHANDADIAAHGNGLPALYGCVQRYPWLKHSFLGDVQRCLVALSLRAVWSEGPLAVAPGDALLFKWTSRPGQLNRSDAVSAECHFPGAIAVPRSIFQRLRGNRVSSLLVRGQVGGAAALWLRSRLDGARPQGASVVSMANWNATFCINGSPNPLLCVPTRHDFWGLFQSTPMLPLSGAPRAWLIHGSTEFVAPPRGPVRGGGCAACPSADLYIPIGTDGTQDVGHSIALGILTALVATDPFDPIIFVTPLDYMEQYIVSWPNWPEHRQAQLNY